MKKTLLSGLLLISTIISLHAQLYTPSGTTLGTSTNNNVGIGVVPNPGEKLEINGNLKFSNNGSKIFLGSNDYIQFTDGNKDGFKFIYDDLERLRITNNGDIGIGVSNPGEKLEIYGNLKFSNNGSKIFLGSNDYLQFTDGNGDGFKFIYDDAERLRITNNGNMGIGVSNPGEKLEIYGNLKFSNNGSKIFLGLNDYIQFTDGNGDGFKFIYDDLERLRITNNGNMGIGVSNPGEKLEIYGNLKFSNNGSKIFLGSNDYLQFTDGNGDGLKFIYDDLERLRITNNGNMGIGVSNPGEKLEIYGNLKFSNNGAKIFLGLNDYIQFTDGNGDGFKFIYDDAERLRITNNGNVGIGTTNPTSKLTVAGDINSREVKVTVNAGADFVFEKDYNLPSLASIDAYVKENKHLPEIASAKEMQTNGINLSEMNIKLLQKMEEMTLYMIEQSKEIETLKKENESFKTLSERFSRIESQLKKAK
jgi:phage gp36-like protein